MFSDSTKEKIYRILHGIFFILCIDLIGTVLWSWAVIRTFEAEIPNAPIAAVLVHDFDVKQKELGDETLRRLDHAADLYFEGKTENILCVGGARPKFNFFGSELMKEFLVDEGIPDEKVLLEKKSYDTKTNWKMAKRITQGYGFKKLIVVSSPFHLHRLRHIIKNDPGNSLEVFYAPYSIKYSQPLMTYYDIWILVHYEWLAHFSQLLPEKIYKKVIHYIRAQ